MSGQESTLAVLDEAVGKSEKALGILSPTKSPYYIVAAAGVIAGQFSCEYPPLWWYRAAPIAIVLLLSVLLSFRKLRDFNFSDVEYREQLRVTRALGISAAMCALVFFTREDRTFSVGFALIWALCILQMLIFVVHSFLAFWYVRPKLELNYVQLTLITTTFLLGTVWGLRQIYPVAADDGSKTQPTVTDHQAAPRPSHHFWTPTVVNPDDRTTAYFRSTLFLGFAYGLCVVIWIVLLDYQKTSRDETPLWGGRFRLLLWRKTVKS